MPRILEANRNEGMPFFFEFFFVDFECFQVIVDFLKYSTRR